MVGTVGKACGAFTTVFCKGCGVWRSGRFQSITAHTTMAAAAAMAGVGQTANRWNHGTDAVS